MTGTDVTTWDHGISISHGYGTTDVDVRVDALPGDLTATLYACSNAIGPSLLLDDPLTVKNESLFDSAGTSILNPGVYLDQVTLYTGVLKSYQTTEWGSCHDAKAIN
jgi:hypothetical protein